MSYPELKKFITLYLTNNDDLKDLTKSQIYMKQFRNKPFDNFSIKDSRTLYMSVLIYRFKNELDVDEIFWKITRMMIFSILSNATASITITNINNYLKHFELWKKNDQEKLISDIASVYYNILETKTSIENEKKLLCQAKEKNLHRQATDEATDEIIDEATDEIIDEATDEAIDETTDETNYETNNDLYNESLKHLNQTLENIRNQCSKINILEQMLSYVKNIIDAKTEIVTNIITKAYWDKIEEDIKNKLNDSVLENLSELKLNMKKILPKSQYGKPNYLLDECFDIHFFKQLLSHNVFDQTNINSLLTITISFLKEWDSKDAQKLYDSEQLKVIEAIKDKEFHQSFRIVLEYITELVSNFIARKEAWEKLLLNK